MSLKKNEEMRARLLNKPDAESSYKNFQANKNDTEILYQYAMSLSDAGKVSESIDVFSMGLCKQPFSHLLHFGRGRKFMSQKQYSCALSDFTMALSIEPEVYSYWYYRAVTNNLAGLYEEAISDFRGAIRQTLPFEQYGLYDWIITSYIEMGDMKGAKKVIDEVSPDLEPPKMHYAYKRRVLLYKELITPEEFINMDDIKANCIEGDNRIKLEVATLLFGLYIYYIYKNDLVKSDETLLRLMDNIYPGAFGCTKGEIAARKRGLLK